MRISWQKRGELTGLRLGRWRQCLPAVVLLAGLAAADTDPRFALPREEILRYTAEWRLIRAGDVELQWRAPAAQGADTPNIDLTIRSAGLVNVLYSVDNHYTSRLDQSLCSLESFLSAKEGGKRRETRVVFHQEAGKAEYQERDLKSNSVLAERSIEIPACAKEVLGALFHLRTLAVPVGSSVEIPVSDGKKSVSVRVEAQRREVLEIHSRKTPTIRYEAYLFRNVLYRRDASAFVWLSDDADRVPVQFRILMPFYIGTVTIQLKQREVK